MSRFKSLGACVTALLVLGVCAHVSADRRYELQGMVAIGSDGFDRNVTVGMPVTFAVEKKTAYIKLERSEYRLLVFKNEPKTTPRN